MNIIHPRTHVIPFQEIAERRVYMQGRGDEETELEFEEELVAGSDIHHFRRQVSKSSITSIWTVKCFCYRWKHKRCSFYETWLGFFFFFSCLHWSQKERSAVLSHECRADSVLYSRWGGCCCSARCLYLLFAAHKMHGLLNTCGKFCCLLSCIQQHAKQVWVED